MTAPLTFRNDKLRSLLNVALVRWRLGLRESHADEVQGSPVPGFWIVGDRGVYLMSNGKAVDEEKQPVVYAEECNSETMPFDDWWAYKRASFGGDDGVEFIDRKTVEKIVNAGDDLVVRFTPEQMEVMTETEQ